MNDSKDNKHLVHYNRPMTRGLFFIAIRMLIEVFHLQRDAIKYATT